ncbi:hypothetical protein ACRRTK_023617 [Alexandromys fortis]
MQGTEKRGSLGIKASTLVWSICGVGADHWSPGKSGPSTSPSLYTADPSTFLFIARI